MLCDHKEVILFHEDIGRHNAIDKIIGEALIKDIPLNSKIVFTSGRVSSEILLKSAKSQIPMIVSRSAPTDLAVAMAKKLGITLVGFVRGRKMNVYTNFENIIIA
jgi:FdhD protein